MSKNINQLIINWYDQNKRDLPWRKTNDPYKIWISEIILQQTRVQQGTAYYHRFMEEFSDVTKLALAEEQSVLQLWQGLGYYSRARNLHKTAKIVTNDFKGVFPTTHADIKQLPGIGDYTASAISSFAFGERQAVLDGNVFRVLSRIFNLNTPIDSTQGKKDFRLLAQEFLYDADPALHNQAIMEFGALVCLPQNPKCDTCPIRLHCQAYKEKTIKDLPVKSKKTAVRNRYFHFAIFRVKDELLITKREEKDIWQHLYQFPLMEVDEKPDKNLQATLNNYFNTTGINFDSSEIITHLLSHQKLAIQFHSVELQNKIPIPNTEWVDIQNISQYPFPKPIVEFLKNFGA
ncbi:MAG: A/G-specific adenine glycosylase [Crocinitomicaceae bacterium]